MESIKWHEGSNQVSIIPAKINQKTYSVDHFKNIGCQGGSCNLRGEMFRDSGSGDYIINFGPIQDTISGIPSKWHSYDFDWASLMTEFVLKEVHGDYEFMRCDFTMVDGRPGFGPIDKVFLEYKGLKMVEEQSVHLYKIDGPGLLNRGGEIWFDAKTNILRGFKIDLPDEDSYQNVDFRFLERESMTLDNWEAFKKSKWVN